MKAWKSLVGLGVALALVFGTAGTCKPYGRPEKATVEKVVQKGGRRTLYLLFPNNNHQELGYDNGKANKCFTGSIWPDCVTG